MFEIVYSNIATCIFSSRNYQFKNFHCYYEVFVPYEVNCYFNAPFIFDFNCFFDVNRYEVYDANLVIPITIKSIEKLNINCSTIGKSDLNIFCYFLPDFKFSTCIFNINLPIIYRYVQNCCFERGYILQRTCNYCTQIDYNIVCYFATTEKSNVILTDVLINMNYNFDVKAFISIGNFVHYLCNYAITVKRDIYCYFTLPFVNVINYASIKLSLNNLGYNFTGILSSTPIFYELNCIANDYTSYNIPCYFNYSRYEIRNITCYFVIKQTNVINLYDLVKAKLKLGDYLCTVDSFVYNREIRCFYEVREQFYKINVVGRNITLKPEIELAGHRMMEGDLEAVHNQSIESVEYDKGKLKIKLNNTGLYYLQVFTKYGSIVANQKRRKRFVKGFIGEFEIG